MRGYRKRTETIEAIAGLGPSRHNSFPASRAGCSERLGWSSICAEIDAKVPTKRSRRRCGKLERGQGRGLGFWGSGKPAARIVAPEIYHLFRVFIINPGFHGYPRFTVCSVVRYGPARGHSRRRSRHRRRFISRPAES